MHFTSIRILKQKCLRVWQTKGFLEPGWYFKNSLEDRVLYIEVYYSWLLCLELVTNACNKNTPHLCGVEIPLNTDLMGVIKVTKYKADRWMNRKTSGWTDIPLNEQRNWWINRQIDEWKNWPMNTQADWYTDRWTDRLGDLLIDLYMNRPLYEQTDWWLNREPDGWTDMNE